MTADDATINLIVWIYVFSFLNPLLEFFLIHLYLKDYLTYEGVNSLVASVLMYLFAS